MDRRKLRNFFTKSSSMWTLGLCMTGAIVLGGIATIDNARRTDDTQAESELSESVYLGQETEENLFYTLDDELEGGIESDDVAVNADGMDAGISANEGEYDAEGNAVVNTDGAEENIAANADGGTTDESAAVNGSINTADAGTAGMDAEEAASVNIVSEQMLMDAGVSFAEDASLMWPSAGTILIDYSMDSSVYFPTLNQYKYNPALIIGSEVGNQVLASAKGIVESIDIDEETGTTLVLNIGNGYRLTYGQLRELTAAEGDVVEAGAVIGYVSEPTKYYSTEGSNLYFAMTQEDMPVDPVLYLE